MSLQNWPLAERLREKLIKLGAAALWEAEVQAVLLQTGTPGCSAFETARGGCSPRNAISSARHALLHASLELSRRH